MELAQASLRFEKLTPAHQERCARFENQEDELVKFLREDAWHQQCLKISTTYLVFRDGEETGIPLGYVALLNDSIRIEENSTLGERMRGKGVRYHYLPALKVGRFAVDSRFQRQGIGGGMLDFAVQTAQDISNDVGCRFLVVDSKRPAEAFYARNGFKPLIHAKSETIKMYLDLAEK